MVLGVPSLASVALSGHGPPSLLGVEVTVLRTGVLYVLAGVALLGVAAGGLRNREASGATAFGGLFAANGLTVLAAGGLNLVASAHGTPILPLSPLTETAPLWATLGVLALMLVEGLGLLGAVLLWPAFAARYGGVGDVGRRRLQYGVAAAVVVFVPFLVLWVSRYAFAAVSGVVPARVSALFGVVLLVVVAMPALLGGWWLLYRAARDREDVPRRTVAALSVVPLFSVYRLLTLWGFNVGETTVVGPAVALVCAAGGLVAVRRSGRLRDGGAADAAPG